jgi:hypothetical protein
MSLLHQTTPEEIDDAARAEEFTKRSSHIVLASVCAAIVVMIAIGTYLYLGRALPIASGQVTNVRIHPRHVVSSGLDANGEPMAVQSFDQVLVFAHVQLTNQTKYPLSLYEILTDITLADGIHSSYAAKASDYDRLFLAFPELENFHGKPLKLETTLQPGQSVEGEIVSTFQMSKAQWSAQKDMDFNFAFRYQPRLVLMPAAPPVEQ